MFQKRSMGALIQILKTQKTSTPKMDWRDLEDHVKHVYDTLLNMCNESNEQIIVARDVQIRGITGQRHQIDVYYEFEQAGVRHRVAIECKNTRLPIDKGQVGAFWLMLDDSPGIIGVMVSAAGYQKGAKKAAFERGILALTLEDLPSISYLIGRKLEVLAIPDETTIGQPFWTLFELENGENNGTIYGTQFGNDIVSALFFSKKHAEAFLHLKNLEKKYVVRGLNQSHLLTFIATVDALAGRYVLMAPTSNEKEEFFFTGTEIPRAEVIEDYCVGKVRPPEEPLVAPSRKQYARP